MRIGLWIVLDNSAPPRLCEIRHSFSNVLIKFCLTLSIVLSQSRSVAGGRVLLGEAVYDADNAGFH